MTTKSSGEHFSAEVDSTDRIDRIKPGDWISGCVLYLVIWGVVALILGASLRAGLQTEFQHGLENRQSTKSPK